MANIIDDKWITPAGLAKERDIPLSTITTWIRDKKLTVLELPGNTKKRRYLVDRTSVPIHNGPGRPCK